VNPHAQMELLPVSTFSGMQASDSSSASPGCVGGVDRVDPPPSISPASLVQHLAALGIRLIVEDGGIVAEGELDRLTDDDIAVIRAQKPDVMQWLCEAKGDGASGRHAVDRAGGCLTLIRHVHRCGCGREFRCTAPACADVDILCVCCKCDEIERRNAVRPVRDWPKTMTAESDPDSDLMDADDGDLEQL